MKPTVHRDTCGTEQGYRAHTKRGETRCQPCKTAWATRCRKYKPRQTAHPNANEVAAEIHHMLKLNQGHGYILTAIGYQGRLSALEKRMRDNGHKDLARWAVNLEREAA